MNFLLMVDEFYNIFLVYFWGINFLLMVDEFYNIFLVYLWGSQ